MGRRRKKKNKFFKYIKIAICSFFIILIIIVFYKDILNVSPINFRLYNINNSKSKNIVLQEYSVFGIDVSEYQEKIDWEVLSKDTSIKFIYIRATAGINQLDKRFNYNWRESKKYKILRGAYHYYRPNENSTLQARNFINNVVIEKGDLPPVLDIERFSNIQSLASLKTGVLNWLKIVEEHYGIKPIIYTYHNFYLNVFYGDKRFNNYPLWVAFYSENKKPEKKINNWIFWQFSDKGRVKGIKEPVDLNVFYSDYNILNSITIN